MHQCDLGDLGPPKRGWPRARRIRLLQAFRVGRGGVDVCTMVCTRELNPKLLRRDVWGDMRDLLKLTTQTFDERACFIPDARRHVEYERNKFYF